jgi:hypothetical protein
MYLGQSTSIPMVARITYQIPLSFIILPGFARASLTQGGEGADPVLIWSGHLDEVGCTPAFFLDPDADYGLYMDMILETPQGPEPVNFGIYWSDINQAAENHFGAGSNKFTAWENVSVDFGVDYRERGIYSSKEVSTAAWKDAHCRLKLICINV